MGKTRSLFGAAFVLLPACATILGIDPVPDPKSAGTGSSPEAGGTDASCGRNIDAASVRKTCGCAYDCLGGTCQNGICQPVVLVTAASFGAGRIFDKRLSLDGANLAWTDSTTDRDRRLRSCRLPDCAPADLQVDVNPSEFSVVGNDLYYARGITTLARCELPGCTNRALLLSGPENPTRIDLQPVDPRSGLLLFQVSKIDEPIELRTCALPDCTQPTPIEIGSNDAPIFVEAIQGPNFYFSMTADGVLRCPLSGCPGGGIPINSTLSAPFVSAGELLIGTQNQKTDIVSCTLPECAAPRVVVTGISPAVVSLAIDGTDAYWLDSANVVSRCPLSGCTPAKPAETLFRGPCESCEPRQILRDSSSVVWMTKDTIYRLALP